MYTGRRPCWGGGETSYRAHPYLVVVFLSTSNPHTCSWRGVLNPPPLAQCLRVGQSFWNYSHLFLSVDILSGPGSPHCLHPSHLSFLCPNPIQTQPQKQQWVLGRVLLGWHFEDQIGLWFSLDVLSYRGTFPKVCSKDLYMRKSILW